MLTKLELTLDCADAAALAEFRKLAVGYVEAPPPAPFATQAEWRRTWPTRTTTARARPASTNRAGSRRRCARSRSRSRKP